MDSKTIAVGLSGVATTVGSIVIPELLPADPTLKAQILQGGLALSAGLYLLAVLFWWRGRREPDKKIAARLAKGLTEAINQYKENSPDSGEWRDREAAIRQSDVAARRLLDRYRTDYQPEVLALLRRREKKGLSDERLVFFAAHPTNPLGVEEIARELGVISHER